MSRFASLAFIIAACCIGGCQNENTENTTTGTNPADSGKKPKIAFVTNGIASFWDVAKKGAEDGAAEFNADVDVRMPAEGVIDQKEILEDLLINGIQGVAVSPIDPTNQAAFLNKLSKDTIYITHDSDAPQTDRVCYIGMDNYEAGRMCGQLVKEAIPDGGEVMLFVGRLEQLNAKLRCQGVIDELLGRERVEGHFDSPDEVLKGDKYTILGTKTDGFDFVKAKEEAKDAIINHANLKCIVGLFAYNPPLLLSAVRDSKKIGQIKIVGFDEEDGTLGGIRDGAIYGTIVQNPYEYGRMSVEVLTKLIAGDKTVVPEDKMINIPARQIRALNVMEFWKDLNQKLGKPAPSETPNAEKS